MSRRAYLRLDPFFSTNTNSYPDGAVAAFIAVLCEAEAQPERGYFRNRALLAVLLDKRKRWISYLIDHHDLVVLPDGRLYVDGWEEWQEGDWKVQERMRRVRDHRNKGDGGDRNNGDGGHSNGLASAVSGKHSAVSGSGSGECDVVVVAWHE